jgi:hypothetical protein
MMNYRMKWWLWMLAGAGIYFTAENYALIIPFIKKIPDAIQQYNGAITALATVVIAGLTLILANENRRLRKAGTEPEVVAYLLPHPDGNGGVNFILANIGQGSARNIRFELEYDADDFLSHGVLLANDKNRTQIAILPQGEKLTSLFGISFRLAGVDIKQPPLKPFTVTVSYDDINGKSRTSIQVLNITQFLGLAGLFSKPPLCTIADSIKGIENQVLTFVKAATAQPFVDTTPIDSAVRQKASSPRSEVEK